jgi:hypothetical protein
MSKENKTTTNKPSQADLMAKLGISESQVESKVVTKKEVSINSNADKLKATLRENTAKANSTLGKKISFVSIKRDGTLKDAQGKQLMDENNKPKPRYVKVMVSGYFVIDEMEDGFLKVTKGVHYTDSHTITEYQELD